ncbi:MAG: hypothetical protein ACK4YP_06840 [Myxococcota bacterium]
MNVTGKLTQKNGTWTLRDAATGRVFQLSGVSFPDRVEGQNVRIVGVVEDSFGLGVLHDEPVLQVQRWNVV